MVLAVHDGSGLEDVDDEGDRSSSLSSLDGYLERCNTVILSSAVLLVPPPAPVVVFQIWCVVSLPVTR
jgi:hypothetical protein